MRHRGNIVQCINFSASCGTSEHSTGTLNSSSLITSLSFNHPPIRAFSYPWSLPVTWQRWRSHHWIRRSKKPHDACKPHVCMFYGSRSKFALREWRFSTFSLLWPWPDDLYIRTWPVFPGDTSDVQIWTSYVKAVESYHLTDRQTDRLDQNYIPRRLAGGLAA